MSKDKAGTPHSLKKDATYTLGRTSHETNRLIEQSRIYGESTRRLCEQAGIAAGMRVLEIGSGAGDVAIMLAEIVGKTGQVVGVDINPTILESARQRVMDLGLDNIKFQAGDAREIVFEGKFDAIVGRFVLMYMSDPTDALKQLTLHLKPEGIVAFQEPEYTLYPAFKHPDTPLINQLISWILDVFQHSGAHLNAGLGLYQIFIDAGLPAPEMHLQSPIGAEGNWVGYRYMTTIFESLLPLIEEYDLATSEEVGVDTLSERLRMEVLKAKRPFYLPLHVTAYSSLPA